MKPSVMERATILGEYIKKNGATVRHTAGVFNISKSTVHKDVTIQNGYLFPLNLITFIYENAVTFVGNCIFMDISLSFTKF